MAEARRWWESTLDDPTVSEALSMLICHKERGGTCQESTIRSYRTKARWIEAYVGRRRVKSLTAHRIGEMYEDMRTNGGSAGNGLCSNSIRQAHKLLVQMFKYLSSQGYSVKSPMDDVVPPQMDRHEAVYMDEAEQDEVLGWIAEKTSPSNDDPRTRAYAVGFCVALWGGLRVAEVCGLRRRDVGRREHVVNVRGQCKRVRGRFAWVNVTKGKSSRSVPLSDEAMEVIEAHMLWQQTAYDRAPRPDTPLVSYDGSFVNPSDLSAAFSALARERGFAPGVRFHSLRHTNATVLLQNGVEPQVVQRRLGHGQTSTTMDIYGHATTERSRAAARALSEAFGTR